jgi:hypothetical protein
MLNKNGFPGACAPGFILPPAPRARSPSYLILPPRRGLVGEIRTALQGRSQHDLLLSSALMPSSRCRIKAFVQQIMLVCVITSLCFSVGEGLPLRPSTVANDKTETSVKSSSLNKYGAVNLPTRPQSRSKRQIVDFGTPPTQHFCESPALQVLFRVNTEGVSLVSLLLRSSATGRAPPVSNQL